MNDRQKYTVDKINSISIQDQIEMIKEDDQFAIESAKHTIYAEVQDFLFKDCKFYVYELAKNENISIQVANQMISDKKNGLSFSIKIAECSISPIVTDLLDFQNKDIAHSLSKNKYLSESMVKNLISLNDLEISLNLSNNYKYLIKKEAITLNGTIKDNVSVIKSNLSDDQRIITSSGETFSLGNLKKSNASLSNCKEIQEAIFNINNENLLELLSKNKELHKEIIMKFILGDNHNYIKNICKNVILPRHEYIDLHNYLHEEEKVYLNKNKNVPASIEISPHKLGTRKYDFSYTEEAYLQHKKPDDLSTAKKGRLIIHVALFTKDKATQKEIFNNRSYYLPALCRNEYLNPDIELSIVREYLNKNQSLDKEDMKYIALNSKNLPSINLLVETKDEEICVELAKNKFISMFAFNFLVKSEFLSVKKELIKNNKDSFFNLTEKEREMMKKIEEQMIAEEKLSSEANKLSKTIATDEPVSIVNGNAGKNKNPCNEIPLHNEVFSGEYPKQFMTSLKPVDKRIDDSQLNQFPIENQSPPESSTTSIIKPIKESFKSTFIKDLKESEIRIISKQLVKLVCFPINFKKKNSVFAKSLAGFVLHGFLENITFNNQAVEEVKTKVSKELKIEGLTVIGNEFVTIVKDKLMEILNNKEPYQDTKSNPVDNIKLLTSETISTANLEKISSEKLEKICIVK